MKKDFCSVSGKPEKFYVRFSTKEDAEKIKKFYLDNQHHNVRTRQEKMLGERIQDGDVVLIENEAGDIVGASVMYPLHGKDKNGRDVVKWQEVGTLRVIKNGYAGLFNILISTQILRTMLVEPPEERIVAKINPAVWPLAQGIGAARWTPTQEVIDSATSTKIPVPGSGDPTENWIQVTREAMPKVAKSLLYVYDNPLLKHKGYKENGQQIEISFERMKFVGKFYEELKILSGKDFGAPDKADPQQELLAAQKRWLKRTMR